MSYIKVIQKEVKFRDGSRIYYKTDQCGNVRRVIDYAASKGYPAEYVDNAGKYYYLKILNNYRDDANVIYGHLKCICDKTTNIYDLTLNRELCSRLSDSLFGHQSEVFFTVIYLAMVDLEASKIKPYWKGKQIVLESCRAVLLENYSYERAAELHSNNDK